MSALDVLLPYGSPGSTALSIGSELSRYNIPLPAGSCFDMHICARRNGKGATRDLQDYFGALFQNRKAGLWSMAYFCLSAARSSVAYWSGRFRLLRKVRQRNQERRIALQSP